MGVQVIMRFCQTTYYEGTVEVTDEEYRIIKEDMKGSSGEIDAGFCPESFDILESCTGILQEERDEVFKEVQIIKIDK